MYLYVIAVGGKTKVGVTSNLESRINGILSAVGAVSWEFKNSVVLPDVVARHVERALLGKFRRFALGGEWLDCSPDEVFSSALSLAATTSDPSQAVDLGQLVQATQIDAQKVNLTAFVEGLNKMLEAEGKPACQMASVLRSKGFQDYLQAASEEWNLPKTDLLSRGVKNKSATIAHLSVALYVAEQSSPRIKVQAHKFLVDSEVEKYQATGGTEFKTLNANIEAYLPGREHKSSNKGVFIQIAKRLREKILGPDATTESWNHADVDQTHKRYEWENKLSDMLRLGVVKDFNHLKELIDKL